jgi:hypothetical protein
MLFKETFLVDSENNIKNTDTLCFHMSNAEFSYMKAGGYSYHWALTLLHVCLILKTRAITKIKQFLCPNASRNWFPKLYSCISLPVLALHLHLS